jgi:hypothetical protein
LAQSRDQAETDHTLAMQLVDDADVALRRRHARKELLLERVAFDGNKAAIGLGELASGLAQADDEDARAAGYRQQPAQSKTQSVLDFKHLDTRHGWACLDRAAVADHGSTFAVAEAEVA